MQAAKSIHKSRMSAHLAQRVVWSHLDKKPFLAVSWSPVGESEASSSWRSKVVSPPSSSRKQSTWQATLDAPLSVHGCWLVSGWIPLLHGCWLVSGWIPLLHGCWLVSGWVASLHGCWLVSG